MTNLGTSTTFIVKRSLSQTRFQWVKNRSQGPKCQHHQVIPTLSPSDNKGKPTLSLCLMAVSLNYFTVGFGWWNCNHLWSKNNHNINISHLKQFLYPKDSCHQLINITWWHIINPVTKWYYHLVTNIEHWLSRDHFLNQFFSQYPVWPQDTDLVHFRGKTSSVDAEIKLFS